MSEEEIRILQSIINALNQLEVKGKQNHLIVIACINDLEKIVRGKEEANVNLHTES